MDAKIKTADECESDILVYVDVNGEEKVVWRTAVKYQFTLNGGDAYEWYEFYCCLLSKISHEKIIPLTPKGRIVAKWWKRIFDDAYNMYEDERLERIEYQREAGEDCMDYFESCKENWLP